MRYSVLGYIVRTIKILKFVEVSGASTLPIRPRYSDDLRLRYARNRYTYDDALSKAVSITGGYISDNAELSLPPNVHRALAHEFSKTERAKSYSTSGAWPQSFTIRDIFLVAKQYLGPNSWILFFFPKADWRPSYHSRFRARVPSFRLRPRSIARIYISLFIKINYVLPLARRKVRAYTLS